ncbi:enoyl-CoA hydratase-related protein [Bdellovibrio reynosensis]|uniref:Enoyl-CoA hydratase-related protein n=1 Tax=Bdellovibrio reynosensis TaxID=2835041 RepID=A0ABY4C916_9BACT|nr:enoyl-CoA hydratase-related protein [Bdellovibrio reynosensis]UOF01476.1 enoyl-CoA hydratase-related protein [Bdellovibrio reynosensis]
MSYYSQMFTHVKTDRSDGILWLTLANQEQSNAISTEMIDSLTNLLRHADFDPDVKVIVITGEGATFCAGGDIKAMENKTGMFAGQSNELRMRYMHGIQQIPKAIEDLSKPIIAMVNGAAIGAGCDLAMMCDIRIGCSKAKFGETFVKLGLVPGDGGTFFLQRVVGYSKAMQMSLTGDIIAGEEAYKWGLLNYYVAEDQLLNETKKLAEKISHNAPVAVQMTKKAMKIAYLSDLNTVLDLSAAYQGITQRTEDHFKALEGMKNKTTPEFTGK